MLTNVENVQRNLPGSVPSSFITKQRESAEAKDAAVNGSRLSVQHEVLARLSEQIGMILPSFSLALFFFYST